MALNLDKLIHIHDFDLQTEALGQIRCGSATLTMLSDMGKTLNISDVSGSDFARKLLSLTGKRVIAEDNQEREKTQDNRLSDEEVGQITDEEVEIFAREFIVHNEWLLHSYEDGERQVKTNEKGEEVVSYTPKVKDLPKDNDEKNSDYLVRVFRSYLEEQGKRLKEWMEPFSRLDLKKLLAPLSEGFTTSVFKDSTLESLKRNFSLSDQLRDSIKLFNQTIPGQGVQGAMLEPVRHQIPELRIPENPLIKTNERLSSVLEHLEGMRPLVAQSAALISNMNDTALRMQADFMKNARSNQKYTLIAIVIATLSLVVTAISSWWSYKDAEQQAKESAQIMKSYQQERLALIHMQDARLEAIMRTMHAESQQQTQREHESLVAALREVSSSKPNRK